MREALFYMRRGELVPDATVWEMVQERQACLHCAGGFILDRFPRSLPQAASLKQLLDRDGLALTAVVNYELPTTDVVARLAGRRTCENCKAVFRDNTGHLNSKAIATVAKEDCFSGRMTVQNRLRSGLRSMSGIPRH
jgi:adenylate kinase family enzyme